MLVLDLAFQGVGDLLGAARATLKPAYNALQLRSPDVFVRTFLEVLFRQADGPVRDLLAPGAQQARAGARLQFPDNQTYQLVLDVAAGLSKLSRLDGQAWTVVAQDPPGIRKALQGGGVNVGRAAFEATLVWRQRDLPRSKSAESNAQSNAQDLAVKREREALVERVMDLDRQLGAYREVEELEDKFDQLQRKRFQIEDQLRLRTFDDKPLAEAEKALASLGDIHVLGEDFEVRFETYSGLVGRRRADLERWQTERDDLERKKRSIRTHVLRKDLRVWLGIFLGIAAVLSGYFLGGKYRYLALLDIPSFGLPTWATWQWLGTRESNEVLRRKIEASDRRRETIMEKNAEEIDEMQLLLERFKLRDKSEVREALAEWKASRERVAKLRAEKKQADNDKERDQLAAELKGVLAEAQATEHRLAVLGQSGVNLDALKDEQRRIRLRLEGLQSGSLELGGESAASTWVSFLKAATELTGKDATTLAARLSDAGSQLAVALSAKRVSSLHIDPQGKVMVTMPDAGPALYDELSESPKIWAFLALKGALFSSLDDNQKLPLVVEDMSEQIPGGTRMMGAFLQNLGRKGQVIHLVTAADQAKDPAALVAFGS